MNLVLRCWPVLCLFTVLPILLGCSPEVEDVPLSNRLMTVADKFFDVKTVSVEKAVVVGYGGKILLTADSGKTWQLKDSGTDLALYGVEFPDEQTGWISGQDGLLLKTEDGGETWQQKDTGAAVSLLSLQFLDKNHAWAVGSQATYLRTTNGGESWESGYIEPSLEGVDINATLALSDPTIYSVHFVDTQTGWMVGEFGKIFHSTDGGQSWAEQQNSLLSQDGITDALNLPTFFGVDFVSATEGIAVGLEGKIVVTTDGGQHWTFLKDTASETAPLYTPVLFDNGQGWIVGASGRIYRKKGKSGENGQNGKWERTNFGMPMVTWLRAIDFLDTQHGWIVGGFGTVMRTSNGGESWFQSLG
jgi:photosystem II stability/assembly factor-like uncharacterized protein